MLRRLYKREPKLMLRLIGVLAPLILFNAGCATERVAKAPMDTVFYGQRDAARDTLLILLPGIRGDGSEYAKKGFVRAVRSRNLTVDLLTVDAHFGYYAKRNVVERLRADVIAPARAQGYKNIWLIGISLGGFGSLIYSSEYPDDITGMVVLAPYLGRTEVIAEISQAGGLKHWQPGPSAKSDPERRLWAWLKNYAAPANALPRLYLGYGRGDKFAQANALLASVLPPQHVDVVSGGHNWSTWKTLWTWVLDVQRFSISAWCDEAYPCRMVFRHWRQARVSARFAPGGEDRLGVTAVRHYSSDGAKPAFFASLLIWRCSPWRWFAWKLDG